MISGECCTHVRKVYLSVSPGEFERGSLPDTFFLPLCVLGFWPWAHIELGITLKQATNGP